MTADNKETIFQGNSPLVIYKLSIDKIVPKERFTFIIQGNIADIKARKPLKKIVL